MSCRLLQRHDNADKYKGYEEANAGTYGQDHSPGYSPPPMGANAAYSPQPQGYYPESNAFPPPPTAEQQERDVAYGAPQEFTAYNTTGYNPSDYPPPPAATIDPHGMSEHYGAPDPNLGYPMATDTFAGDGRYDANGNRRDPREYPGAGPENVSSTSANSASDDPHGACS